MSDLTERLRNDAAYDRWNLGEGEVSNAAEAADRIDELEAALREVVTLGNPPPSFRVAESLFADVARRALEADDE